MIAEAEKKLISVIVPIHNAEQYLRECIDSVINQTYRNIEIILIDDGSTDESGAICDEYSKLDSRITVTHNDRLGVSNARNCGLRTANGEYILFVDSDDYIDLNYVEALYENSSGKDLVFSSIELFDDKGTINKIIFNKDCSGIYILRNCLQQQWCDYVYAWGKLIKKDCIKEEFPSGKIHEDIFWTPKVWKNCCHVKSADNVVYHYRNRPGSIVNSAYTSSKLDALEADIQMYYFYKENILFTQQNEQFLLRRICTRIAQGIEHEKSDSKIKDALNPLLEEYKTLYLSIRNNNYSLFYKLIFFFTYKNPHILVFAKKVKRIIHHP